jgi:hypothetical protein
MVIAKGFWSYVHADDDAEGGRITDLARDLAAQYEMLTGESIDLFLDRDDLTWGTDWRAAVDGSLAATAFFIPVLSPRYFLSAECRRELNGFVRKAKRLGLEDLVLPILYVDSPALRENPPSDGAVALVKPFQWVDWTELRFASKDSPEYRKAVGGMAARLVEANSKADAVSAAVVMADAGVEDDDSPGSADLMARAESTLPEWGDTVQDIVEGIDKVRVVIERGTEAAKDPKMASKGFAGRLTLFRQMAKELQGPIDDIQENTNKFAAQLNDVDAGIMEIIPRLAAEIKDDPSDKESACGFFETLREMAFTADEGLGELKQMIDAMGPLEGMSRDLRAPVKTLRRALTSMYESRKVMNAWATAIDETGIDCGGERRASLELATYKR